LQLLQMVMPSALIVKLEDYVINSNLQMTMKKYFDEGTDEWIQ